MAEVGKRDLSQFKLWYSQAGTPKIQVTGNYDSGRKRYELNFTQSCAPTPGQAEKRPFLIPIAIGLLGSRGESIQLPNAKSKSSTVVVELDVPKKSVVFENIDQQPVPSLLRNFSAPVALDFEYSDENLKFLLSHDSDPYCRFEAGQRLALRTLKKRVEQLLKGEKQSPVTELADAYIALLQDEKADPAFRALALPAPSLQTLCDAFDPPDFDAALAARRSVVREIAVHAAEPLRKQYEKLKAELGNEYQRDGLSMGKRALKNMCLSYLIAGESSEALQLASAQYKTATNMTDSYAAYQALLQTETKEKEAAIASFYERWKNDAIVLDMWFVSQISVPHTDALAVMLKLEKDPAVDLHNPNKLEAIYGSFSRNLAQFHRPSGEGYRVFVDRILTIDAYNPNVSARFANAFHWFRRLDPKRKILVRNELKRMLAAPNLSKGLYEIVQRTLDAE
jgi:aminopeptidase N